MVSPHSSWQSPLRRSRAGSGVTVRVEGVKRTLLPATVAHAESGSITKGGTPKGSCPGSSAAGYFDSATHHNWKGTYSSGLGVEITSVLGETHTFSAKGFYWGVWVNDKFASAGLCDLKLKPGDQLLLAPAPGQRHRVPDRPDRPGEGDGRHGHSRSRPRTSRPARARPRRCRASR